MVALTVTISLNFKEFIYSYYPLRVLTTFLIYWIGYQAVIQLRIANERQYIRKKISAKKSFDEEIFLMKKFLI
ncbi:hypothetical protein BST83_10760 [Polaribacter filamentus]|uniref:Uncharacterized protein n=1 Tax=Polaribacter filamentus TaxID=53483 RepID=A0A2S7KYA6_9FLAO|nr:hypothetical protein BST83_10760 [Polaribacter filamentus]